MPTYTVQLNVNVPTIGDRQVIQTGIVAVDACAAVAQAKANVIMRALQVQETSPQP